jgi:hypothetical protein
MARPVSANFPFQVQFGNKFRAHLQAEELELIEAAPLAGNSCLGET